VDRLAGHVSVGAVLAHERVVAERRRAISAGTRRFHDEPSPGRHTKGSLAVEPPYGAVGKLEPAIAIAVNAGWRE